MSATGDGRAVLAAAAAEPSTLAIGLDANARSMAEASRRAAASARRGGLANALFYVASAERPPPELERAASSVTVRFPWGSLLRGCLQADDAVAAGLVRLLAQSGELELLLAPAGHDRLAGLPTEVVAIEAAVARAFGPLGLDVIEAGIATAQEIRDSHSTWARRLLSGGRRDPSLVGRAVVLVRLRRPAPARTRDQ